MKEYKQPQIEVYENMDNAILAGSLETKPGNTDEQLAKQHTTDFDDFEDDEDDEQQDF